MMAGMFAKGLQHGDRRKGSLWGILAKVHKNVLGNANVAKSLKRLWELPKGIWCCLSVENQDTLSNEECMKNTLKAILEMLKGGRSIVRKVFKMEFGFRSNYFSVHVYDADSRGLHVDRQDSVFQGLVHPPKTTNGIAFLGLDGYAISERRERFQLIEIVQKLCSAPILGSYLEWESETLWYIGDAVNKRIRCGCILQREKTAHIVALKSVRNLIENEDVGVDPRIIPQGKTGTACRWDTMFTQLGVGYTVAMET
ncbi:hypothetical protein Tco_0127291 [Tanacetum coccineum]